MNEARPEMAQSETASDVVSDITVTVKLFSVYQEAYGVPEVQLRLPAGSAVATVCDRLIADRPHLAQWRDVTRFGINLQFVEPTSSAANRR